MAKLLGGARALLEAAGAQMAERRGWYVWYMEQVRIPPVAARVAAEQARAATETPAAQDGAGEANAAAGSGALPAETSAWAGWGRAADAEPAAGWAGPAAADPAPPDPAPEGPAV